MKRDILCGSVFLLTGVILLGAAHPALGEEGTTKDRTVMVQGNGKAAAPPDQAQLEFEVQVEAVRLEEASSQAKSRMNEVLKAVRSLGVPEKAVQTLRYNVQPKYRYDKEGGEAKQVGFTVSNRIRVRLKDLDLAGKVLEAVTRAGATGIEGPNFGFADPSQLEIKALQAAMADAKAKAEALAQAAGASLGRVISIQQNGMGMPSPRPMMTMALKASAGVPVEKGEDEVTAQVEVVFSLK